MRFLVDENLSPDLCRYLHGQANTAEHVHLYIGAGVSDQRILDYASSEDAVIVTADTDFGALLAHHQTTKPSLILVRELLSLPVAEQGQWLTANLGQLREPLAGGAIVVFSLTDIRVRPLPIA